MTEDDTYEKLRRPSLEEMNRLFMSWRSAQIDRYPTTSNIQFMKKHGWTWLEFLIAKKKALYPDWEPSDPVFKIVST